MPDKKKIVFVCTHNAGKSRIAEAYLNQFAGDRFEAVSAGTDPSAAPRGEVVDAMSEEGIAIPDRAGQSVTPELTEGAVKIVTFGCDISGAGVDPALVDEWRLIDPTGEPIADTRAQRDEIRRRVRLLIQDLTEGEDDAD